MEAFLLFPNVSRGHPACLQSRPCGLEESRGIDELTLRPCCGHDVLPFNHLCCCFGAQHRSWRRHQLWFVRPAKIELVRLTNAIPLRSTGSPFNTQNGREPPPVDRHSKERSLARRLFPPSDLKSHSPTNPMSDSNIAHEFYIQFQAARNGQFEILPQYSAHDPCRAA